MGHLVVLAFPGEAAILLVQGEKRLPRACAIDVDQPAIDQGRCRALPLDVFGAVFLLYIAGP
jgi:hypothetical protein